MASKAKGPPQAQASATLRQMEKQIQTPPLRAPVLDLVARQKTGTAS